MTGSIDDRKIFSSMCEQYVRQRAVGFVFVDKQRQQADCFGSGTLVTVGGTKSILTAAHVISALVGKDKIGLVGFPNRGSGQLPSIDLSMTYDIAFGARCGIEPDIALIKLPKETATALESYSGIFYNLDKRKERASMPHSLQTKYVDFAAGVVDEWSDEIIFHSERKRVFYATFVPGNTTLRASRGGFDYWSFAPEYGPTVSPPGSYKGVSGGGVWRFFYDVDQSGKISIREQDSLLLGPAYFETDAASHGRAILFHGPEGVYGRLLDEAIARWGTSN